MIRCDEKPRQIEEVRGFVFRCYDTSGTLETLWFRDLASAQAFARLGDPYMLHVNRDSGCHAVVEWKARAGMAKPTTDGFAEFLAYRAPKAVLEDAETALRGLMF